MKYNERDPTKLFRLAENISYGFRGALRVVVNPMYCRSYCVVRKAVDWMGRIVAMKMYSFSQNRHIDLFRKEVMFAAQLSHENVVEYYDWYMKDNEPWVCKTLMRHVAADGDG